MSKSANGKETSHGWKKLVWFTRKSIVIIAVIEPNIAKQHNLKVLHLKPLSMLKP